MGAPKTQKRGKVFLNRYTFIMVIDVPEALSSFYVSSVDERGSSAMRSARSLGGSKPAPLLDHTLLLLPTSREMPNASPRFLVTTMS